MVSIHAARAGREPKFPGNPYRHFNPRDLCGSRPQCCGKMCNVHKTNYILHCNHLSFADKSLCCDLHHTKNNWLSCGPLDLYRPPPAAWIQKTIAPSSVLGLGAIVCRIAATFISVFLRISELLCGKYKRNQSPNWKYVTIFSLLHLYKN